MLPMLSGIQELVNVIRYDLSDDIHSDILESSGVPYYNDSVDPNNVFESAIPIAMQSNTLAAQAYGITTDASLPVQDFQPTAPKSDVVTFELHDLPDVSKNLETQTPKPLYTLLTSKNELHSTKPDTRNSELNQPSRMNSFSPSEINKTSPEPIYTVFTSKAISPSGTVNSELMNTGPSELSNSTTNRSEIQKTPNIIFSSARSIADPRNTGPNGPSKPKTIRTEIIRNTNTNCSSASPLLYRLLKVNTPLTASASLTSEAQLTFPNASIPTLDKSTISSPTKPNRTSSTLHRLVKPSVVLNNSHSVSSGSSIPSTKPAFAVPNTNCVIRPNSTQPNSGLNTLLKTNSNYATSCPQFQQTPTQVVTIVPSASKSQNCRTKPVIKANAKLNNRQAPSQQVQNCVPHKSSCDGSLSDVKVKLAQEELWKLFYDQGNEMVVAKNGRPLFPILELDVSGLDSDQMYSISVRFICVDEYRYHFNTSSGKWEPTHEDRHQPGDSRCFEHPASPANGHNWSEKSLAFRELRLANRATKAKNMVFTPTLRKHRVQLVVTMLRCSRCRIEHTRYIDIPLTDFIAVSSYYSVKVTDLKIAHNPMAKTRCSQRKRKDYNRKSSEDVLTSKATKKQKTSEDTENEISGTNRPASDLLSQPINSATHMLHTEYLTTATCTPLLTTPDMNTFSKSKSQLPTILSFVTPSVLRSTSSFANILPSTSSSQTAKEQCSTVYICQTTKPTAHVQADDDILEYIKIYLSPFLTSEKNEAFDSSVFDELFNVNYISEKLDNFDLMQHFPMC